MFRFLTVAACVFAGSAAAQDRCVTARDLSRGIVMTYAEGDVFEIQRGREGRLVLVENYSDGSDSTRFTGAHALYVETEVLLNNGVPDESTRITIDFGQPSTALPVPTPGGGFTLDTVNIFADGSRRDEIYTAAFGDTETLTLGRCTYNVIPARLRYSWPGESDGMSVEYAYLPDIGAAFLLGSQFDAEDDLPLTPVSLTIRQK